MTAKAHDQFHSYVIARSPALLRLAYLLTGNTSDAEELVQTALTHAFVAWHNVQDSDSRDAYVRRLLINTNIRRFRGRRVAETLTSQPPQQAWSHGLFTAVEDRLGLAKALASLPARQRAADVLRYCEDRSEKEVADIMGCSLGTVKSQTAKGLAKLRTHPAILFYRPEMRTAGGLR